MAGSLYCGLLAVVESLIREHRTKAYMQRATPTS